jgi:hypothetical protein
VCSNSRPPFQPLPVSGNLGGHIYQTSELTTAALKNLAGGLHTDGAGCTLSVVPGSQNGNPGLEDFAALAKAKRRNLGP